MIADYFPQGTPRDGFVDLFQRSLHRRRHRASNRRVRARGMGTSVPESGNGAARPRAMASRVSRGGLSGAAPGSLDMEPEGAAARSDRRPPIRHRPSQRLARFRTRACGNPSAANVAERRTNSRRDSTQFARSCGERRRRVPARHTLRRLAAVDRLVDRNLCGLQLDPVAQAKGSGDAQAHLGHADYHHVGHRLRQHQLRELMRWRSGSRPTCSARSTPGLPSRADPDRRNGRGRSLDDLRLERRRGFGNRSDSRRHTSATSSVSVMPPEGCT